MNGTAERIQLRVHEASSGPTLIYLPGLHGDWTLVSSFRAAVRGRARFAEFTYPRTTAWTLEDYARAVIGELLAAGVESGWLIGESYSSQVAWKIIELTERGGAFAGRFTPLGIFLAGGFVRHPTIFGVHVVRWINSMVPPWMMRILLRIYAAYAHLRHRKAPETFASIEEFVARRTEEDRQAILHRYTLISGNDLRPVAERCQVPVYYLSGLADPIVPWLFVRWWLRRHCPALRDVKIIWNADHAVLATQPVKSAEVIFKWIGRKRDGT